ncbi:MAG: 2-oxo acid dehydrogenase subunit E2 [Verrucomicrobia bacterium]|nr:2-oxo acid dehydrogenase subunit E2 [Verrucomicrobiota bacterium]MBU6445787.1 2-oxo acid dehydrogenase subunit E2 [Verrucomicrobiota bacterium]MDE3047585.1 2-oxo acid dehydrogenase subunit E2 [Verrucomicrobiota bacterium]
MKEPVKITLPKLGESIVSATVVQWFKKVGDPVALDEPLLEVSTDKVNSEIPSPVAGVLQEIFAEVDQEIQVGEGLASVATEGMVPVAAAPKPTASCAPSEEFLSPSVMRLLREKGIALSEIDRIPHSGEGGRLTKKDVDGYMPAAKTQQCSMATERVKMSAMRKAIADNMVKSFYAAPHASLITEVDVTQILKIIQQEKQKFLDQHGAKLTISAFVARAISRSLQGFPLLNASLDGDTIVMKRNVNLGVAVSVDQGVMVPVIKDCQHKNLAQIAKEIAQLADRTRNHALAPDDIQNGSITMTNFGMTGTMIGIPIIRHPEVAIVGLGAITKKVMAMPDDSIAIRSTMFVSLTFDHRVLDGIYGCSFLNELKKQLEAASLTE